MLTNRSARVSPRTSAALRFEYCISRRRSTASVLLSERTRVIPCTYGHPRLGPPTGSTSASSTVLSFARRTGSPGRRAFDSSLGSNLDESAPDIDRGGVWWYRDGLAVLPAQNESVRKERRRSHLVPDVPVPVEVFRPPGPIDDQSIQRLANIERMGLERGHHLVSFSSIESIEVVPLNLPVPRSEFVLTYQIYVAGEPPTYVYRLADPPRDQLGNFFGRQLHGIPVDVQGDRRSIGRMQERGTHSLEYVDEERERIKICGLSIQAEEGPGHVSTLLIRFPGRARGCGLITFGVLGLGCCERVAVFPLQLRTIVVGRLLQIWPCTRRPQASRRYEHDASRWVRRVLPARPELSAAPMLSGHDDAVHLTQIDDWIPLVKRLGPEWVENAGTR